MDLRAFRLVTKNLRATLFRGHIEENHVLRFLSLDEKSALLSTRKARERLLLNENYNTTTYYNNDGERRSRKTGRAHDDDDDEKKKKRKRKKEQSYPVDDDNFYVCGLVVRATERTLRLGENFPRRDFVLGPGGAWRRGRRPSLLFSPRNDDDDDDDDDDATLAVSRRGYRNAQKGKTEVGSGLTQA